MARAVLALACAALALAGCVGEPAAAPPGGPPSDRPAPAAGYAYACPGAASAGPEPCLAALASAGGLSEPYVALHPADARVAAVGANFGAGLGDRGLGAASGEETCTIVVHVTADGGGTWREAQPPRPPVALGSPRRCVVDPALAFDPGGRLHLTGLASSGTPLPSQIAGVEDPLRWMVYATRSDDLGATWTEPVVLADGTDQQDRNWLTRDPATGALWVVWQNNVIPADGTTAQAAVSQDGGATWTLGARAPCANPGRVVFRAGQALTSCKAPSTEGGYVVLALDAASAAPREVGRAPGDGQLPTLAAFPDGRLALWSFAGDGANIETTFQWSADGGATWTGAAGLRALAGGDWTTAIAYWAEPDARGGLHVLARLARPHTWAGDFAAAHLVLGPDGQPAHLAVLAVAATLDPAAPTIGVEQGDDFWGIGFAGDRALLAFTWQGAVRLTELRIAPG